jgi:hypothetical protein
MPAIRLRHDRNLFLYFLQRRLTILTFQKQQIYLAEKKGYRFAGGIKFAREIKQSLLLIQGDQK